jgi:hypothetical protein
MTNKQVKNYVGNIGGLIVIAEENNNHVATTVFVKALSIFNGIFPSTTGNSVLSTIGDDNNECLVYDFGGFNIGKTPLKKVKTYINCLVGMITNNVFSDYSFNTVANAINKLLVTLSWELPKNKLLLKTIDIFSSSTKE